MIWTLLLGSLGFASSLHVNFLNRDSRLCDIRLTRVADRPASYDVTHLVVPGLPLGGLRERAVINLVPGLRGEGLALTDQGFGNFFQVHRPILDAFNDDDEPVVRSARRLWPAPELRVARAAQAFARGEAPGRGYYIKARRPALGSGLTELGIFLILPDETYPRGLIVGGDEGGPTWDPILNLRWPDRSAIVRFAYVREAEDHRGPSYRVVLPAELSDLPDLPTTSRIIPF